MFGLSGLGKWSVVRKEILDAMGDDSSDKCSMRRYKTEPTVSQPIPGRMDRGHMPINMQRMEMIYV